MRVRSAQVLEGFRVLLEFSNGLEGIVDLRPYLEGRLFGPLRNAEEFSKLSVDASIGTISWPNGADINPNLLYEIRRPVTRATGSGPSVVLLIDPNGAVPASGSAAIAQLGTAEPDAGNPGTSTYNPVAA